MLLLPLLLILLFTVLQHGTARTHNNTYELYIPLLSVDCFAVCAGFISYVGISSGEAGVSEGAGARSGGRDGHEGRG